MPQSQTITFDEKLALSNKACLPLQAGDREGYNSIMRTIPMPSYLAKIYKEKVGVGHLTSGEWNLSEAEAEFGPDWLNR